MACLHCLIHEAINAHAAKARPAADDGTVLVLAPEALTAIAAVLADIISSGTTEEEQGSAFSFLMQQLARGLNARGVETTVTKIEPDPVQAEVLH